MAHAPSSAVPVRSRDRRTPAALRVVATCAASVAAGLCLVGCAFAGVPAHPVGAEIVEYGPPPQATHTSYGTVLTVQITDPSVAEHLASLLDHLRPFPRGAVSCPAAMGQYIDVTFSYSAGPTVTMRIGSCDGVQRVGQPNATRVESPALMGELNQLLQHATVTHLAD